MWFVKPLWIERDYHLSLGKRDSPIWFWNRPRCFVCGFEIRVDHFLGVAQCFESSRAIGDDAWEFRHLGEEVAILFAPLNNDLVAIVHRS
jgi:hypothetical protein